MGSISGVVGYVRRLRSSLIAFNSLLKSAPRMASSVIPFFRLDSIYASSSPFLASLSFTILLTTSVDRSLPAICLAWMTQ